jgi:hypothetical protein
MSIDPPTVDNNRGVIKIEMASVRPQDASENNSPDVETRNLAQKSLARAKELVAKSETLLVKIAKLRETVGDEFLRVDEEKCKEEFDALKASIEQEQD